jgi:hypothetical protein
MTRSDANELFKTLVLKYRDRLSAPPKGLRYQECYDWDSIQPHQGYLELVGRIEDELAGYGLQIG